MTVRELREALMSLDGDLEVFSQEEAWLVDVVCPVVTTVGVRRGALIDARQTMDCLTDVRQAVVL